MMIRVMYCNGGFDLVKPSMLDTLLEDNALISFKRSDGWAVVGRDPLRQSKQQDYKGPGRRSIDASTEKSTTSSTP